MGLYFYCGNEHPLIVSRNVLGCASLQMIAVTLFAHDKLPVNITLESLLAIIYLGVICGGFVYFIYMILVVGYDPLFTSLTNYLVPTFGVLISSFFANEHIGTNTWCTLVLILLAVGINEGKPSLGSKRLSVSDSQ